jgi:hypothetical protein
VGAVVELVDLRLRLTGLRGEIARALNGGMSCGGVGGGRGQVGADGARGRVGPLQGRLQALDARVGGQLGVIGEEGIQVGDRRGSVRLDGVAARRELR